MSLNKSLSLRRKEKDIFKLRSKEYKVQAAEAQSTYSVQFRGPPNTPYERGKWIINLFLPEEYPYKSPSVGFLNKIYHPNIDYASGSVCLDVINQTWTPMYELVNVFEIFLPQLLTYPNPSSPLNHEAAELYERNTNQYTKKVMECIQKHALADVVPIVEEHPDQAEVCEPLPKEESVDSNFEDRSCSLSDCNSQPGEHDDELNMY